MTNPEIPPLDVDIILQNLNSKRIGRKVVVYSSTTSTNDLARQYAQDRDNDGLVIFAEEQTAGKGRFNNKWHSYHSESILCSFLLIGNEIPGETISMACAVAVAQTLGKIGRNQAKIKWPNDIIINGKKIAGILIESERSKNINFVIIGIGINCHQQSDSFPAELRSSATSIDIQSNSISDRNMIAKRLLYFLDYWLDAAITEPQKLTSQWQQLSNQIGEQVTLVFNGRQFTGSCIGIDPEKGLILQLEMGGIRFFDAAHSSIAK
jgi:BirA family transcriptional regulator, biotin operon repressor / biotin---[acetyl-CoA-carboxylase] ligase